MAAAHRAQHLDRLRDAQQDGKAAAGGAREPARRRSGSRAERAGQRPAAADCGGARRPAGRSARGPGAARDRGPFVQAHRGGARSADRHRHVAARPGAREAGGRAEGPPGKERPWTARRVRRWSTRMSTVSSRRAKAPSSSAPSKSARNAGGGWSPPAR